MREPSSRLVLVLGALVAAGALLACSAFSGGGDAEPEPEPDAGSTANEAGTASPSDAGGLACDPKAPFGPLRGFAELQIAGRSVGEGTLTPDELTIYFTGWVGDDKSYDIFVARRATREQAFSDPTPLLDVDRLETDEAHPWISPDLRRLLYISRAGVSPVWTLRQATRSSPLVPFEASSEIPLGGLSVYTPFLATAGGKERLFFAAKDTDAGGTFRILEAPLAPDGKAGPAEKLALGSGVDVPEISPVLSSDGLTLYFASGRQANRSFDVWVSRRASLEAAWEAATAVDELNSSEGDFPMGVSPDGCRIYVSSFRSLSGGIYVAERPPAPAR